MRRCLALTACLLLTPVPASPTPPAGDGQRAAAAASAWHKLDPTLRLLLAERPAVADSRAASPATRDDDRFTVVVRVTAGSPVDGLLERPMVRPLVDPLGQQTVFGEVRLADLMRLAAEPSVASVDAVETSSPAFASDVLRPEAERSPCDAAGPAGAEESLPASRFSADWHELTDVHHTRTAWARGHTGAGVQVMVNDTGVDFCHPDLEGTWATVTDPTSPYFGWPLMFDAHSMYLYARDQLLGELNVALGLTGYADTSATCDDVSCSYQPIGAAAAHAYTVTGTSLGGTYHIGSHPDPDLEQIHGERVAVLVADEAAIGAYDTVYVDLNANHDFTDDVPARRASPAACRFGATDLSGGLVYFVADGANPVPASDWLWGLGPPSGGSLVAFMADSLLYPGSYSGTLCASVIAGQGIVNGNAPPFKEPYTGPGDGMVVGAAPEARLIANHTGSVTPGIDDGLLFAVLGYDGAPETADDAQILTQALSTGREVAVGWDLRSRRMEAIQRSWAPHLSVVTSVGNGGPGYGTVNTPSPPGAIRVGVSTLYGWDQTFDHVTTSEMVNSGSVAHFSGRGPDARGAAGVDVVATGAWGPGDTPLNHTLDADVAWDSWGGGSRSANVAAGVLALVYQAWAGSHGGWPTAEQARALLMSGAADTFDDPLVTGAGLLDADRSTDLADGPALGPSVGVIVEPPGFSAGGYQGLQMSGFAAVVAPGGSATQELTISNPGAVAKLVVLDAHRHVTDPISSLLTLTTTDIASEDPSSLLQPNYVTDVGAGFPTTADLLMIRMSHPFSQFENNGDTFAESRWAILLLDWLDDGDGSLWSDGNGNFTVNAGELDPDDQFLSLSYSHLWGPTHELRVTRPFDHVHDGLLLGLSHRLSSATVPTTDLLFGLHTVAEAPWAWMSFEPASVTVPAGGVATVAATVTVTPGTPPGLYVGAATADDGLHRTTVPVTVNVAAELGSTAVLLGGQAVEDELELYDNGSLRGLFAWSNARPKVGDWRLFFVDAGDESPPSGSLMVRTTWEGPAPPNDVDAFILGPTPDPLYSAADPMHFGPYRLDVVAGSRLTNNGTSSVYAFHTSSGGPSECVAAPLAPGLHAVALHHVRAEEGVPSPFFSTPFAASVGRVLSEAEPHVFKTTNPCTSFTHTVTPELALEGLEAEGFGLSCRPRPTAGQVPSRGWVSRFVSLDHCGLLEVTLDGPIDADLDLWLLDPAGQVRAIAEGPTAVERLVVPTPENGAWEIQVFGAEVPGQFADFRLTVRALQGYQLGVNPPPAGPLPAGEPVALEVEYCLPTLDCVMEGVVRYGPPGCGSVLATTIVLDPRLFADDFESGDATAWSFVTESYHNSADDDGDSYIDCEDHDGTGVRPCP